MNRTLGKVVVTTLAVLAPVTAVIFHAALGGRVPDPLPTHWRGTSTVDGTTAAAALFVSVVLIAAVLAAITIGVLWLRHSDMVGRMTVCALMFGVVLMPTIYGQILISSSGAVRAEQVPLPWYAVVITVAVPVLIAAACWWLLPAAWQPVRALPASTIPLGPTERIAWIGWAQSTSMRWVAAGAVVIAGALLVYSPWAAVVVFVVAVLLLLLSELAVRIDGNGLHTLWGPFGWPSSSVALEQIGAAHAETIEPVRWGGWGLRVSGRGVAAIVRRGPGIVLDRVSGPAYVVTVDGADQGADVLNALLARARQ